MKLKRITAACLAAVLATSLIGCSETGQDKLSLEDKENSFGCCQKLTVFNCVRGDTIFQMVGVMRITESEDALEIIVTSKNGGRKRHRVGLCESTCYIVEDISFEDYRYRYEIEFNPDIWKPADVYSVE